MPDTTRTLSRSLFRRPSRAPRGAASRGEGADPARQVEDLALLRAALSDLRTPVLICDRETRILYANRSGEELFRAIEADLRTVSPSFSAAGLVGSSVDMLYRTPRDGGHGRGLGDTRNLPPVAEVELGAAVLRISARDLLSDGGEALGGVLELENITQARKADQEVQRLISAGQRGILDERADLSKLDDRHRTVCDGINRLLDAFSTPIREVSQLMERIASGDMCATVTGEFENDLQRLKEHINTTVRNLCQMVSSISTGAEAVAQSAGEISAGVTDLSQRTEEQASSLQATASSMEQMTASVKQNAENARQANLLAVGSREVAEKGGAVVRQAVLAMEEINQSSKKIADIINVIDEIAFQTNLLALNAAVEAARAGEQGRGFAVVAAEVRNLAGRSATAAKEIKALIRDSVQKVQDGSQLVQESGKHLENIVASVKKVTDIVSEISVASQEQSTGIEEVNDAIMQMDRFTQQNAALVEETACTANLMEQHAGDMKKLVEPFRLPDAYQQKVSPFGATGPRPAAERPPRPARNAPLGIAGAGGRGKHGTGRGAPVPVSGKDRRPAARPALGRGPAPDAADLEENFDEF